MRKWTVKKNSMIVIVPALAVILLIWFCWWQTYTLTVTNLQHESDQIPDAFDGMTIVQVSDLHNQAFGENQKDLLDLVASQDPDLLLLTGDLIDTEPMNDALAFVKGAVKIAPCYYVPGNHEGRYAANYELLRARLMEEGVHLLEDEGVRLEKDGQAIWLLGIMDNTFRQADPDALGKLTKAAEGEFRILLSHRPESFDAYVKSGVELVFCGHAHGGQIRLPMIGGLYAPGQGFFPKYTSGMHVKENTTMVVSRGLGNSTIVPRIFNFPEIVALTLKKIG